MIPYSDDALRVAINLDSVYRAWVRAERSVRNYAGTVMWKHIAGRDYLYRRTDREGNGHSLGPRSAETEAAYEDFHTSKELARKVRDDLTPKLVQQCSMYRALRLPMIARQAAALLREADIQGAMDKIMVVGTTAIAAYQLEAAARFNDAIDATEDFDLAWTATTAPEAPVLLPVLQAVDSSYTVNMERTFQARNRQAFEVELLAGPSRVKAAAREQLRPVPLDEQEWLLEGVQVDRVVCGLDGTPARIVAPDPRWFALQKAWMAEQPKRNPLKRPKDARQALAIWAALASHMPHYPLDQIQVPAALAANYDFLQGSLQPQSRATGLVFGPRKSR